MPLSAGKTASADSLGLACGRAGVGLYYLVVTAFILCCHETPGAMVGASWSRKACARALLLVRKSCFAIHAYGEGWAEQCGKSCRV